MIDIIDKKWKKNWSGGWSLLSSSFLGYQYTKQLEEKLGRSLKQALFVCHKGKTDCYFIDDNKQGFADWLIQKVNANHEILVDWAASLKTSSDKALKLIENIKVQPFSPENFKLYIEVMYDYGVFHRIIKVIVDYLPTDILSKYLDVLTEARVYAEPVYEETENYMKHIATEISENNNISPELILAMTKEQFDIFMSLGSLPEVELLKNQYDQAILYMENGKCFYIFNKQQIEEMEKALLANGEVNIVRGQKAFSGKVIGKARIIFDPRNTNDFKEGEILITGMTRPEYLSIVEKSAGFITDAGGVLSHAAITARELKKPCIVGTEMATKLFHDGDLIELDADNGTVRKLN